MVKIERSFPAPASLESEAKKFPEAMNSQMLYPG